MAKGQNIVHQYFKKQLPDGIRILVKVNPLAFTGTEITLEPGAPIHIRDMEFDEEIMDDLKADKFETCSPLEFNLYLSGLA
jgi:quercetin dioxygenase-like cupin family protein